LAVRCTAVKPPTPPELLSAAHERGAGVAMPFAAPNVSPAAYRLARAALQARLQLAGDAPVWAEIAWISAWVAVLGRPESRLLAGAALRALGQRSTPGRRWRFAWATWYAQASDACLALEAQRLTAPWLRDHLRIRGAPPPPGSILVTVHHAGQFLGFLRLAQLLPSAALVTVFDPRAQPATPRARQLGEVIQRTFGSHLYPPARATRPCLELLGSGGSVILVPDFFDAGPRVPLLGRAVGIARGPVWLAERTGRPIIPYLVASSVAGWELCFGAPIEPSMAALVAGLEGCIRRAPTVWLGWRDWLAAPPLAAAVATSG